MNKFFEVVTPITSTKYERVFLAGEVIDLTFASDEDCLALLASGAVKETQKRTMTPQTEEQKAEIKEAKKAEVKNG